MVEWLYVTSLHSSTHKCGFYPIQIEIAKNYGTVEWHEDLKLCLMQAGVDDKSVVFLFNDTQVRQYSLSQSQNQNFGVISHHLGFA